MIENVQIINKNGDGMFTEGICYVEIISTGKKYLFYTLNERVDNDLIKLYIAESSPVQGEAKPIEQEAWDDLKKKMVKISHKEEVPDIKFVNMKDEIFNVSEAKKLAVTAVAKQAFKDAQITNTMSIDVSDESAMPKDVAFFNSSVVGSTEVQENNTDNSESVFSNPPQPEEVPVQQVLVEESAMPGETVDNPFIQSPIVEPIPVETPVVEPQMEAPVVETTPVVEPVAEPVAEVPMAEPVVEATPVIETPVVETPIVEQQIIQPVVETTTNNEEIERLITDDEAMKAIEVIQAFIDQEGGNL